MPRQLFAQLVYCLGVNGKNVSGLNTFASTCKWCFVTQPLVMCNSKQNLWQSIDFLGIRNSTYTSNLEITHWRANKILVGTISSESEKFIISKKTNKCKAEIECYDLLRLMIVTCLSFIHHHILLVMPGSHQKVHFDQFVVWHTNSL